MAHLGDYFIYTAMLCSVVSAIAYVMAWRFDKDTVNIARLFYRFGTVFIVGAISVLLYLILTHDFTFKYVFSYSSSDLPLYYLISTLWGGQEGTLLLWITMASIMGLFMMVTARQFERGNMFWLNLFLISILAILIKQSPFALMPVFRAEGSGLNPLLINFWMTIHPPIMFLGFAGTVIPFCFALTALVDRQYIVWSEAARRWTLFAWTALGIAIVMGGYWAYETLGWGGYWAWDPVENASLIPWIFLTAQLHTLFVKRQRRGLMRFSLIIVCLTFCSVLYGTFLTRSGVLADFSVHSFVDLGINQLLITGLVGFVGLSAFLVAFRWRDIKPEPSFSKVNSRTYLTALGIVVLFVGAWLVLLGTSAPLITRVMENPSAVDMSYYFTTMAPIAILILLLVTLAPVFRWNEGLHKPVLLILSGVSFVTTIVVLLALGVTTQIIYLLLFGAGAASLVTNGYVFFQALLSRRLLTGYLAHIGLALALIGAAASSGFATKMTLTLPQGVSVAALGYDVQFASIEETELGFDCHVDVTRDGQTFTGVLVHEMRPNSEGMMRKPHVKNYLLDDLYLSPLALDQPESGQPGTLYLTKGESAQFGGYSVKFIDFETGGHGENDGGMSAAAVLEVTAPNGDSVEVRPMLRVEAEGIVPVKAGFGEGQGTVEIVGLRPEEGGVTLHFEGEAVPPSAPASLVIELSRKPLIQIFWLGTLIVFFSGVISVIRVRWHGGDNQPTELPGAKSDVSSSLVA